MGTSEAVARRLMDEGILEVRLARNPVSQCEQKIGLGEAIDAFRGTHMSPTELATETGQETIAVSSGMEALGFVPAFDPKKVYMILHERELLALP